MTVKDRLVACTTSGLNVLLKDVILSHAYDRLKRVCEQVCETRLV